VQISVNVSARDLLDGGLAGAVERGLASRGLAAEALLLEVSERTLTSEPARTAAIASSVASIGVPLSLDDFASGRASLARLRGLPVSEIKIDSSFVAALPGSADDALIVKALVDLARALCIRSVAKGVESPETATALRAMGCDVAQGWHFSRPLNVASATAWLADGLVRDAVSQRGLTPASQRGTGPGTSLTAPSAAPSAAAPSAAAPPAGVLDSH
jgi:EAL domain-containing protein (putative c-di-GMP-specific phosphodiesterase class I)